MSFKKLLEKILFWRLVRKDGLYEEDDPRTFGAKVLRGQATKYDLVDKDFQIFEPELVDQLDNDFCVGESRNYGAQATEEDLDFYYSGAFAFAVSKFWGDWRAFGTSILAMCKGAAKYGICRRSLYEYKKGKRDYFANPANITAEAYRNAELHKAESYFKIENQTGWDKFDLFRAFLYKFRDKKCVIHTGVDAHAITLIGQKKVNGESKLFGPDSYGKINTDYRIGKSIDGIRYFNRWEANQLVNGYMLLDMPRSLAEILVRYNEKVIKLESDVKCYLVRNGKKHYIPDEKTAWSHGFLLAPYDNGKLAEIITKEDFEMIPDGDNVNFTGGINEWIVRRIGEKYNIKI